jgi:hypothetical protein
MSSPIFCTAMEWWNDDEKRCVPRAVKEQITIWQGECGGDLIVDLSWRPRPADERQGARTRPKAVEVVKADMESPSTPVVGLRGLTGRLRKALSGVIKPQGGYKVKKTAAKKRTAKASTKAKAKTRTTRKKK